MTDMIPADKVRKIAAAMRAAMRREDDDYSDAEFLDDMSGYIADLQALLPTPPRPTLADISVEERAACQWMQADVAGHDTRYVIATPDDGDGEAVLIAADGRIDWIYPSLVTPRPDLPRLEWPGTENPAPAPALPEGWRLADHEKRGRVIVTNDAPNAAGHVCFVSELTYPGQETDTTSAVPPNTLAVGSEWDDKDALERACRESGRDQIVVTDCDGDVFVWGAGAEWWESGCPLAVDAPYTIIHAGRKTCQ